jgi:hypothetical protein
MSLFDLKHDRKEALDAADTILARAETEKRQPTDAENALMGEHLALVKKLNPQIEALQSQNTIGQFDPVALLGGRLVKPGESGDGPSIGGLTPEAGRFKAAQFRAEFAGWAQNILSAIGGAPKMEAAAPPSGP